MAACEERAAEDDTIFLDGYIFDSGSDSSGWKGSIIVAFGSGTEGMCEGYVTDHVMTSPSDGVIVIESRTRESQPFARDGEDFCDTDDAQAAADGQPCTALQVVTASFTAPL
jgi:hypothetical protein